MGQGSKVERVYRAASLAEQEAAYDDWASNYEPELCAMGYRVAAMVAAVFARHVPPDATPILDAGCGGGIQAEPLAALGYGPLTGIDLSDGMLTVARAKGIYAELRQMTLGEPLDFPDDHFAAVLSSGTITPNHAPPHAFEELLRVTQPGGLIVFSLRSDPGQEPAYPERVARIAAERRWIERFSTPGFQAMPYGEPEITNRIHAYEVL